jgi:hypothetical protein
MIKMPENSSPIGLLAFDSLRAEDEPWLDQCYVPPPDFDLIAGTRSAIVFGAPGSGKTALFRALQERLGSKDDQQEPATSLAVNWQPTPIDPQVPGSTAARLQLLQIFGDCADALLVYLARWPDRFSIAPSDVQDTLIWFINHYLGPDTSRRVRAHAAQAQGPGQTLLNSLSSRQVSNEWLAAAKPDLVINEFIKALREIGLGKVYVLIGPDTLSNSDQTRQSLQAFFSSLTLFENPHFVYKMVLPMWLQDPLVSTGVIRRRRTRIYTLSWHLEDLITIVVKRTALASGSPVEKLAEICKDKNLSLWLERTGGDSPRGWLECIAPLVAQYLRRQRTISTEEWHDIRTQSSPRFMFDPESESAMVGWRRITDLPEVPRLLLSYLYENRERVCTRSELYHLAYLPTRYPDATEEERREYSADNYDSVLDTAISRLRKRIEPDPQTPMYVITERGKGYKLENAW